MDQDSGNILTEDYSPYVTEPGSCEVIVINYSVVSHRRNLLIVVVCVE